MNKIKAVFFDVDGTLVSFNTHQVSENTLNSIKELRKKGVKVFIASGRNLEGINIAIDFEVDGYASINGGYCITPEKEIIHQHFMDYSDKMALLELQQKISFPCIVMAEKSMYVNYINSDVEFFLDLLHFPKMKEAPLSNMLNDNVLQFVVFLPTEQDEMMSQALKHCDNQRWHPVFVDLVPSGSNKGVGIEKMASFFGINIDETMAFGDGGNDIPMIKTAAVGIAMGNAPDDVKAEADYVTDSVDNDGVMKGLQHFRLI